MENKNSFNSSSVKSLYFTTLQAIKKVLNQSKKPIAFPISYDLPKSNLFESAKVIIKDEWGNAEIHVKPKVAVQEINVTLNLGTPKYKVYNSSFKEGFRPAYTEDEAWDLVGQGSVGSLYEVRYWDTDALVPEFMPF